MGLMSRVNDRSTIPKLSANGPDLECVALIIYPRDSFSFEGSLVDSSLAVGGPSELLPWSIAGDNLVGWEGRVSNS